MQIKTNLHIKIAAESGISYLKNCYCTTPLKVLNISEDKQAPALQLMLMSSSPGILDGDAYDIKIELDKNSSLKLHTQSYQRLFTMQNYATQKMHIRLAKNAAFTFIPHPVVPHVKADFTARNNFFLEDDCSLIFGEIITCGRKLNGEIFQFSKYHSVTEIFINNKLVIKENLLMQPLLFNLNTIGQLQGFTHQASLIYLNENVIIKPIIMHLLELLSTQNDISAGISMAPVNGLIVRLLGQKAEQLFDCLKMIGDFLPEINTTKPNVYAI